ncbi:MAG: hypothetical protein IJZ04_03165 [Clostridia bacterium]|nr:hypothetical protein [Clostridia bacterium]
MTDKLRYTVLGFTHDLDYRKIACARGFQSALSNSLLSHQTSWILFLMAD